MDDVRMSLARVVGDRVARCFARRVEASPEGCWIWTGFKVNGYGRFNTRALSQRTWYAHRFTYLHLVGPVPDGLVLDHFACDNKACCNPDHVRPVTQRENTLRCDGPSAKNAAKDFCVAGHPLSGENLLLTRGERHCRACNARRAREYRERRKSLA